MRYRPFGRSGLQVSELVFGGGWVGGILIHQDDATKRRALERALEAGINWIDTAPSYGDGQSEEALGRLLEGVARKPYLSTKVRLDLARLDDLEGQVEASLEQSLKRLRCDSVELLQLHNRIAAKTEGGAIAVVRTWDGADVEQGIRIAKVQVWTVLERTDWLWEARELAIRGVLVPRVAGSYAPEAAADAQRRMEAGGLRGRAVIVF